jgi:hypothetical protein
MGARIPEHALFLSLSLADHRFPSRSTGAFGIKEMNFARPAHDEAHVGHHHTHAHPQFSHKAAIKDVDEASAKAGG